MTVGRRAGGGGGEQEVGISLKISTPGTTRLIISIVSKFSTLGQGKLMNMYTCRELLTQKIYKAKSLSFSMHKYNLTESMDGLYKRWINSFSFPFLTTFRHYFHQVTHCSRKGIWRGERFLTGDTCWKRGRRNHDSKTNDDLIHSCSVCACSLCFSMQYKLWHICDKCII